MIANVTRFFRITWYHLYYDVYLPIFRPKYSRAVAESNEELLGAIGWIDLDL